MNAGTPRWHEPRVICEGGPLDGDDAFTLPLTPDGAMPTAWGIRAHPGGYYAQPAVVLHHDGSPCGAAYQWVTAGSDVDQKLRALGLFGETFRSSRFAGTPGDWQPVDGPS